MSATGTIRSTFSIAPMVRRERPLGENDVIPRQHYILHMPLVMLFVGIIVWMFGSEPMMVFGAIVGSVVGFYVLIDWLFRNGPLRLSTILAMTLLLAYAFGALNTWLTLPRAGLGLAEFLGRDPAVLARAITSVLFSCAFLLSLGELFEKPIFSSGFRIPLDGRAFLLIYLGTTAIVIGFATGKLTTGGIGASNVGDFGQVSVISAFLVWLLHPLFPFTVAVTLGLRRGFKKILFSLISLFLVVVIFTQGRRVLLFSLMMSVFTIRLSGYRIKGSIFKNTVILGALAGLLLVGTTSFILLRVSSYKLGTRSSLFERIRYLAQSATFRESLQQAINSNTSDTQVRTFMLGFYSDVLEGSARTSPMFGRDLVSQLEGAIPRSLFPEKDVTFGEETLADEQFQLNYTDAANSILTTAVIDFGLAGAILLPLVVVWILRRFVEFMAWHLPVIVSVYIVLSVLFVLLQPEIAFTDYALLIRDGVLFSIGLTLISSMPIFRLHAHNPQ